MVKVGDRLTSPKSGWKRYEENVLTYSGSYFESGSFSGGSRLVGGNKGSFFAFGLKGNKFALIDYIYTNRCDFDVYVNGELFDTYINPRNIDSSSQVVYYIGEVQGKENHIKVVNKANGYLIIDCIDVPEDSEIIPYDENYKGYLTFIKDNNTLHTKEGEKPFTKENLTEENGYDISKLDRKLTTFHQPLESESFYKKSTINLKKYFDIHSIGVK